MLQEASQSPDVLRASIPASKPQYETLCQGHRLYHLHSQARHRQGCASWVVPLLFPVAFLSNQASYRSNEITCYFDQIRLWGIWHRMKTGSQQPPTIPNFGTSRGGLFQIHYFGAKTAFSGRNTIPTTLWPHSISSPPKREQEKMFLQLRPITSNCCAHTLKKSFHMVFSCLELHLMASASLCEISCL